ncbi:IS110 family transposase, partial [Lactobacillus acetotolerans]|uniref:IS110 family transposase n=1 Tax=Lactobacillus acetotolerans TaxID=1600 RepID=UPI0019CFFDFC
MKSLVVFGIDVSSRQSTVAVVINRAKLPEFKISNDLIGFKRLGKELELYHQSQIIFEATGVYSQRLQAFLERNNYDYIRMNPLT